MWNIPYYIVFFAETKGKPLSNNGNRVMIVRLKKNTPVDSDGGAGFDVWSRKKQ